MTMTEAEKPSLDLTDPHGECPPWLDVEAIIPATLTAEMVALAAEARGLLPQVDDVCRRAFELARRWEVEYDKADVDSYVITDDGEGVDGMYRLIRRFTGSLELANVMQTIESCGAAADDEKGCYGTTPDWYVPFALRRVPAQKLHDKALDALALAESMEGDDK